MSSQQLHALKRCVNSKVDASKQAEVIEPAEEAVEAVNKQTQDPAEGCSNCTVLSNKLRKLKKKNCFFGGKGKEVEGVKSTITLPP